MTEYQEKIKQKFINMYISDIHAKYQEELRRVKGNKPLCHPKSASIIAIMSSLDSSETHPHFPRFF